MRERARERGERERVRREERERGERAYSSSSSPLEERERGQLRSLRGSSEAGRRAVAPPPPPFDISSSIRPITLLYHHPSSPHHSPLPLLLFFSNSSGKKEQKKVLGVSVSGMVHKSARLVLDSVRVPPSLFARLESNSPSAALIRSISICSLLQVVVVAVGFLACS